ncbi:fused MFS/spermidine synthase [Yoonia sp.]|nr:fused MFS/spermidine synthase [Yoonia sp.]
MTTKISTDLGSFPLIWILPLSLYLLTFVLTFTNKPLIKGELQRWLMIIGIAIFGVFLIGIGFNVSAPVVAALMLAFFFIALNAHRILYESRPDKSNLTIFYVTMSVGGALGGLFNSIIAPILFADIEEARVTIVLAALLLCVGAARPTLNSAVKLMLFGTAVISPLLLGSLFPDFIGTRNLLITTALFFLIALILNNRNKLFVAVVTLMTVSCPAILTSSNLLFEDRSFFGAHKVRDEGDLRIYSNGTTIHGAQYIADMHADRPTPLSYYYPEGPIGQVMQSEHAKASTDIGVVGLGIGAMSCFARPGQSWQFYEIDLMVDQIARNPDLFTFMSKCAGTSPTHLGDARIVLEQQADTKYDILVIDTYSSDAVPMHLTTNEAIELYKNRLKPGGLIMMHISNRFYDISLPLGRSAADLGLESRIQFFDGTSNIAEVSSSTVVIFSQDIATLAEFDDDERWKVLESDGKRVWTDDFANLLTILR